MANYQLEQTGAEVQALLNAVESPDTTPAAGSSNLITSGAVQAAVAGVSAEVTALGQKDGLDNMRRLLGSGDLIIEQGGLLNANGTNLASCQMLRSRDFIKAPQSLVLPSGWMFVSLFAFNSSKAFVSRTLINGNSIKVDGTNQYIKFTIKNDDGAARDLNPADLYEQLGFVSEMVGADVLHLENQSTIASDATFAYRGLFTADVDGVYRITFKLNSGAGIVSGHAGTGDSILQVRKTTDGVSAIMFNDSGNVAGITTNRIFEVYLTLQSGDYVEYGDRFTGSYDSIDVVSIETAEDAINRISGYVGRGELRRYFKNDSNVPCIHAPKSGFIRKTLFNCLEDGTYNIYFRLASGASVASDLSGYTTFEIRKVSGGVNTNLILQTGNAGVATLEKSVSVILSKGDYLEYGDRINGTYEAIEIYWIEPSLKDFVESTGFLATQNEQRIDTLEKGVQFDSFVDKNVLVNISNYKTKRFCLLHFSDIHNNPSYLDKVIEYLDKYDTYKFDTIFTGDINNFFGDSIDWWTSRDTSDFLICLGNHEIQNVGSGYSKTANIGLPAYNKFIKPFIAGWGTLGKTSVSGGALVFDPSNPVDADIFQPSTADTIGQCYYFKDYSVGADGVRLIVLDWLDYNSTQKEWMQAVLADARTKGLSVIVMAHYPSSILVKTFNNFDAFWSGNEVTEQWLSVAPEYDAHEDIQDFIDAGGKFVCWIGGHTHRDLFGTIKNYPDQICVLVTASFPPIETDLYMAENTALNLFSVDLTNGLFYLQRIGAKDTIYGQHREALAWDYVNHKLVRE